MASSWLSGSQAHSALLSEALLVAKLLLAATPAFDRSLARPEYRSRSPCARLVHGLSPGEHNFDPLSGDTHRWTTWNPPKYAAQRARPFARHYHTHATMIREVAPRIVSRRRRRWRMGRGREGRTCIAYTRYVSPPRDPTKRNDSRPSSGDRGRLRGSGCHTEFAGLLQRRERGRVAWIRGRRQAGLPAGTLAGPTVVRYSPDDVSLSPIADCSAYRRRGVSSVARARSIDHR